MQLGCLFFADIACAMTGTRMALRMEHAPVATKEDGDEEGRLCALCKQNCYFSFVAWCGSTVSEPSTKHELETVLL